MKQILSLFRPHVIRVAAYSCISKIAIALCVLFAWNHFINKGSLMPLGIVDTGFFAVAIWFILGAWIQYLSLDGVRPFQILQIKKKNRSIHAMDDDELDEDEEIAAKLFSNLAVAILFLIPNLLSQFL